MSERDSDRERADADAAAWLVRLAEAPGDAALRARFELWQEANPLNAEIWARTDRAYQALGLHRPRDRALWQRSKPAALRFRFPCP